MSGGTINRWTSIEIQGALVKGARNDPWTLDELDAFVPTGLMAGYVMGAHDALTTYPLMTERAP